LTVHRKIRIEGRVQEVWFRDSTRREAQKLGIVGFVRNEPDGSVYIEAEGNAEILDKLEEWCHIGSENSVVSNVIVTNGELKHFDDFCIEY